MLLFAESALIRDLSGISTEGARRVPALRERELLVRIVCVQRSSEEDVNITRDVVLVRAKIVAKRLTAEQCSDGASGDPAA